MEIGTGTMRNPGLGSCHASVCRPETRLVQEQLDGAVVKSHGDAIHTLRLSHPVIRPISLWQIQREQKALEGVPIVGDS